MKAPYSSGVKCRWQVCDVMCVEWTQDRLVSGRCACAGVGGSRQVYTYEMLLQYADSPLSKPPPAGLAAFPAELARKVTPRRAPPPLACPSLPPHRMRSAWPPLHHPNYLAALLCRNFY